MDQPRGVKRKRPEVDPETKFGTKLFHTIKEVQQTAKKARSFETQRVVKKIHRLKKSDDTDPREKLSSELNELKALDPHNFASAALRARLLKDSHISSNDAARSAVESQLPLAPPASKTTEAEKIRNRLASNRTFAKVVGDAVASLRAVLLLQVDGKGPIRPKDDEEGEEEEEEVVELDGEDVEVNEEVANTEEGDWESGSVDEDADDGWESGSIHSDGNPDEDASDAPPLKKTKPVPVPPKSKPPAALSKAPPTQSQFLPSLAVGYIRGSSSDGDDDVEDVDPGRKNRRGQRARRAIWEKKYGRGANHKKKEAAEAQTKMQSKPDRRNASGANAIAGPAYGKPRIPNTTSSSFRPAAPASSKPAPQASGGAGLHPSWAAKRVLKEKEAARIVPSQGKKIVFD
ncbi:Bud-site selection protein [Mycena amicta]|nr:Bud-site selection protein [Mycena amicta]